VANFDPAAITGDISWWSWSPAAEVAAQYIAAFNGEYPNIKVTYKQIEQGEPYDVALRPALASDEGPDIFQMNPGPRVKNYGDNAIDLAPALALIAGENWRDGVTPGLPPLLTTADGRLVAVSGGSVSAGNIWVNQDLFDQFKVQPPTNFDEWEQVCKTFEAGGVTCFAQGAAATSSDFLRDELQALSHQVAPGVFDEASRGTKKWTDPGIVKAMTVWKSMFDRGIIDKSMVGLNHNTDAHNMFNSGKAAMIMMGTWNTQYTAVEGMQRAMSAAGIADPKPFPMVPIAYPAVEGTQAVDDFFLYINSDYGLAVNKKSKQQEAASVFAVWFGTSPKAQQMTADILNNVPARVGVSPNWDGVNFVNRDVQLAPVQKLYDTVSKTSEPRKALIPGELNTAFGAVMGSIAEGVATPEEAAAALQKAAEDAGVAFTG
jgi:ABC-type glycerol-3-phosphate transport system substrate-binding protein